MSGSEGQDPVDGRWTGCGRAGGAGMAWEEGSGGRAVEGCGRAGAAEIAWEEAREARSVQK